MSEIEAYFHCRRCLNSLPPGQSPRDYARLEAGFTPKGIQVWCTRHDVAVITVELGDAMAGIDLAHLCEECEGTMPRGSE